MSDIDNALPKGTILKSDKHAYKVEKVLGSGGFGITYLASANITVGNVPLKVNFAIKEHFINSDCERDSTSKQVLYSNPAKERIENSRKDFIAEAKRLQKVGTSHRNIVRVNEVFEANNTAYYVMEYLDGKSLRSYVKGKGNLTENEMLSAILPITDAVGYLHSNKITHLDIKPDNIMLTNDEDGSLRPVLIDFGLSKHYDKSGRPTSSIKTLGCSDGYSPIEQYAGITTFSPTADIYSLGATMVFCLLGKDPIKSTDIRIKNVCETLKGRASDTILEALAHAMATSYSERTTSVHSLLNDMHIESFNPAAKKERSNKTEPIHVKSVNFNWKLKIKGFIDSCRSNYTEKKVKNPIMYTKLFKIIARFFLSIILLFGGIIMLGSPYYFLIEDLMRNENTWNDYILYIVSAIFIPYPLFFTYFQTHHKNSKYSRPLLIGLNMLALIMIIELCLKTSRSYLLALLLLLTVICLNILVKRNLLNKEGYENIGFTISSLVILAILCL
jgi:serine/threonine protein kinase